MKTADLSWRGWLSAALLLVPLAATSCKREPAAETAGPAAEIRGEPIQAPPTADVAPAAPSAPRTAAVPVAPQSAAAPETPAPAPPPPSAPVPVATTAAPAPAASSPTATPATPGTAARSEAASAAASDEPLVVGFDKLSSFVYEVPEDPADTNATTIAKLASQIPAPVKALDKRSIALKGFMLPLKVEGGLVTELLIMRDQSMCCFGAVPKINEWVSVKMTTKGVKPIMDQPVTLFGRLHVGEIRENGYLVGIYQMDGERMAGPLDL